MNYEEFIENEYRIYKTTTDDPMEWDDWLDEKFLKDLYSQLNPCVCGESWNSLVVHNEKTPCFYKEKGAITMNLTNQEKTLLKMLLNQQYQFLQFSFNGSKEDQKAGIDLVWSIQDKLLGE